jgi:hypothetical protein
LPFTCFFSFNFVTCKNNSYIRKWHGYFAKDTMYKCGLRFLTFI